MKKALLFLFTCMLSLVAQAQHKILFEEKTSEAYQLKYSSSNQAPLQGLLQVLEQHQVTTANGRPPRKPELTLRFMQQAQVIDAGEVLHLKVQLMKPELSGSTQYKDFHLGDALLPARYKAQVKLLNAKGEVVHKYTRAVEMQANGAELLAVQLPDTAANQNYRLLVEQEELEYQAKDVTELRERLRLVQAYYTADVRVLQALQEVSRIRPDDIDRLTFQNRQLQELERSYTYLKDENLPQKLNLKQQDPQRLTYKLKQLEEVLQERRKAINYSFATLDEQFYNRGLGLLQNGNGSAAQAYFAKAVDANPHFAPAHVQLARLDLRNGYLREATNRTLDVLIRMRTDPHTKNMAIALAHEVYLAHLSKGNGHTSEGYYQEALEAYAAARDFCGAVGGLRCNLQVLNDGEAKAAGGLYRTMLEQGKKLLAQQDLQEAERVANEALRFQRQYDYALHNAGGATELLGQVKFQYYLLMIDKGKQALAQQQYQAALTHFEEAEELEQNYTLAPVRELRQLAQRAAKPVLLAMLRQGYEQAMQNNLSGARSISAKVNTLQERHALVQDKEVQQQYTLLRERIFTQECANAQANYDKHFRNAQALEHEQKFIAADQAYSAAIQAAEENQACAIASFTAQDARAVIAAAVAYQRQLEQANYSISRKKYTDATIAYEEARKLYLAREVNKFGLDHISLYNFAKGHRTKDFTAAVVGFYIGMGEEQVALDLLKELLAGGYRKGKTKKVQQQLGQQLAQRDVQQGQPQDAKQQAAKYSQSNRNLKKLRKAYEKERKRLSRQG